MKNELLHFKYEFHILFGHTLVLISSKIKKLMKWLRQASVFENRDLQFLNGLRL